MPAARFMLQTATFLLCSSLCTLATMSAVQAAPSALAVKAALLFKLPRFVYLPYLEDNAPLTLCILDSNPFGQALQTLAQTPVDGRTVQLHMPRSTSDAQACNLAFLPDSANARNALPTRLQALAAYPMLTVSDIPGFAQAGGMVELADHPDDQGKVQIVINQSAAASQGIRFNAQLLRLATLLP